MEPKDSFDEVAALYAEVRPAYPAALYDDLAAHADLTPSAAVLEVGCGSGQATSDLAARARHVVAIDPGAQLIAQARTRVTAGNVAFVVAPFETFATEDGAFDLVASAQAWHWIPPDISYPRAARLLTPRGTLAVFGHVPARLPAHLLPAFKEAFDRHWPGIWGRESPETGYRPSGPFPTLFARSGLFAAVTHRAYAWTWRLDADTYGKYLRTDSGYRLLPEAQRFALFDSLVAAVARDDGAMAWAWETHLYTARRRETAFT